ncbi:MAG: LamG domain-containing protein [Fibrobacterales bacterium]
MYMQMTSLLSLILFWLLTGCSSDTQLAGASDIETGGYIAGTLYTPEGGPEAYAPVVILPRSYNPIHDSSLVTKKQTVTDAMGRYQFTNITLGTYSFQTLNETTSTGLYKKAIDYTTDAQLDFTDTVKATGAAVITLPVTSLGRSPELGKLYIENTTIIAQGELANNNTDSATFRATFSHVPPGVYTSVYWVQPFSLKSVKLTLDSMTIISSETLSIESDLITPIDTLHEVLPSSSSTAVIVNASSSEVLPSSSSLILSSSEIDPLSSSSTINLGSSSQASTDSTKTFHIHSDPANVTIEQPIDYSWSKGITMELWVLWEKIEGTTHMIHLSNGSSRKHMIIFGAERDNHNNKLKYAVSNTDNNLTIAYLDNAFEFNQWNHFAVTVTQAGIVTFYINGAPQQPVVEGINPVPLDTIRTVNYIGKSTEHIDGAFQGGMDNIRIWNTARSADQITASRYQTTPQIEDTTGLVLSYDFDYDSTQVNKIHDASGNGHTGIINSPDSITDGEDGEWRDQEIFIKVP